MVRLYFLWTTFLVSSTSIVGGGIFYKAKKGPILVGRFSISAVVTGTSGRQFKALDGEWQVLIIGIVDEESVIDGFLQALGFVALGDKGTS